MIKMQQLSLRNDIVRKMLGLPDTGALAGNTSPKSLHEGQKIMQVKPSEGLNVVDMHSSYYIYMHHVQLPSC